MRIVVKTISRFKWNYFFTNFVLNSIYNLANWHVTLSRDTRHAHAQLQRSLCHREDRLINTSLCFRCRFPTLSSSSGVNSASVSIFGYKPLSMSICQCAWCQGIPFRKKPSNCSPTIDIEYWYIFYVYESHTHTDFSDFYELFQGDNNADSWTCGSL